MSWIRFVVACLVALAGLWGCSNLKEDVVGPVPSAAPLTFREDIRPILQGNCLPCHSGGRAAGQYDLSSFAGIFGRGSDGVPNVVPGDSGSKLVAVTQPGGNHADRVGSAANASALRKWVVEDSLGMGQPPVHPQGWMDVESSGFHGRELERLGWDLTSCQSCHGADYGGGIAESACTSCHVDTPEDCSTCHGSGVTPAPPLDLSGNFSTTATGVGAHQAHLTGGNLADAISCTDCHAVPQALHDQGHVDSDPPAELTFGALAQTGGALPSWNGASCATTYCHGEFKGGNSAAVVWTGGSVGAECGTCHDLPPDSPSHPQVETCELCHGEVVDADRKIIDRTRHVNGVVDVQFGHPEGFGNPSSENFHTFAIQDAGWQLTSCQSCHGADYAGGSVDKSCLTCHPRTPEDCSTCHGSSTSPAPPEDLAEHTDTTFRGVGAHQSHLTASDVARALECSDCHVVPTALGDAGHVDTALPAEVTFGSLATTGGANPSWDGSACTNAYCHGTFEGGSAVVPVWSEVGTGQADCGTCHGTPPPAETGHPGVSRCSLCHPRVADDDLNILDKALHINGQVEIGQ